MPLTPEEATSIKTDLESGKAIAEIELLKPLGDVVVRTKAQETAFKTNLSNQIETEKVAPRIKELHDMYDDDLFKITGKKRPPETKSYDHLKAVVTELNTKATSSEQAIKDLKDKIEGEGVDVLKSELEGLRTKYSADLATKENEIKEMQGKHVYLSKTRVIDNLLSDLSKKFMPELPPYFESHKKEVINRVVKNSKLSDDGNGLVLLKPDGTAMINEHTYQPVTLENYLSDQFKDVIKTGAGGGGAGGGTGTPPVIPPGTPPPAEQPWKSLQIPAEVTDDVSLREWMDTNHRKTLGDKFNESFNAILDEKGW
jgi:hypothetical protein